MKIFILTSILATFLSFGSYSSYLSGTVIGTSPLDAEKAFDGDESTYYISKEGSYSWVGLDLGSPFIINKVEWTPYRNEKSTELGVFQGANNPDFSDAVPIYLIDDITKREAVISCSRGFRYVRYVGPSGSYCLIAGLSFFGEPGEGDDSQLWQITNLPTISINTINGEIPFDKETYISSTFILISDNGKEILEQSETGIRERGNASREFPKKPWKIKFNKKQNILDAPAKAKKWTLLSNYGDKTLMRNMLAFDIASKLGMKYVPYCTFVDVVLNGEYKGCYQLCDQIEVNEGRLDIDEMKKSDIEGESLTGGYLVEVDGYAYDEPVWFQTQHYYLPVTVKSPDEDVINDTQLKYISDYFNNLEKLMKDTSPLTGYRTIFDNESFIQHMLVNEVSGNTDAYWSTYMYKRRNDPKIYTGPVWDFDLGFNNDFRTYPVSQRSGNDFLWNTEMASAAGNMKYFAQRILTKDEFTKTEILNVWKKARENGLTAEWLEEKVLEYQMELEASQKLNFMRWPILDRKVHMNAFALGSYEAECSAVKAFMAPQIEHLDKIIGYEYSPVETGIHSNMEEEAQITYFTLDGLLVDTPLKSGIYIEKRGSLYRKILLP